LRRWCVHRRETPPVLTHTTTTTMANTELSLEQLQDISGGFLLALLLGCNDKEEKKKDDESTTWVDVASSAAICKSGSEHKHAGYPDANCPDNPNQK